MSAPGHKQSYRCPAPMSAVGGKADETHRARIRGHRVWTIVSIGRLGGGRLKDSWDPTLNPRFVIGIFGTEYFFKVPFVAQHAHMEPNHMEGEKRYRGQ